MPYVDGDNIYVFSYLDIKHISLQELHWLLIVWEFVLEIQRKFGISHINPRGHSKLYISNAIVFVYYVYHLAV